MSTDMNDPYGYTKMTATDIRKEVMKLVASNIDLKDDKKEYAKSINDVIKENDKKISAGIAVLKTVGMTEAAKDAINNSSLKP